MTTTEELLRITLAVAVPLWVDRLRKQSLQSLIARAPEVAQVIAEHGDVVQFRSKKKGETANAFNRLAEGIAILSFVPGGVKFLGDHYENEHPDLDAGRIEPNATH